MLKYGFITFRSQPCDKKLDEEFYQLMTPMLNKAERYVVSQESPLTPDAHYHIVMSYIGDISKLQQKFVKNKSWTNWINSTKSTMTIISTPKFQEGALQLKSIKSTEEDLLHTIGYVSKENVLKTKGFTEHEITEACKYYHTCERKKPEKPDNSWKILNIKSVIPYMEMVAEKNDIEPYHKLIFAYMAKEKMYIDLSDKSKDNVKTTLCLAHQKQDVFGFDVLADQLNGKTDTDLEYNSLFHANQRIKQFHKYCKDKIPDFNYHDLDGY